MGVHLEEWYGTEERIAWKTVLSVVVEEGVTTATLALMTGQGTNTAHLPTPRHPSHRVGGWGHGTSGCGWMNSIRCSWRRSSNYYYSFSSCSFSGSRVPSDYLFYRGPSRRSTGPPGQTRSVDHRPLRGRSKGRGSKVVCRPGSPGGLCKPDSDFTYFFYSLDVTTHIINPRESENSLSLD